MSDLGLLKCITDIGNWLPRREVINGAPVFRRVHMFLYITFLSGAYSETC